MAVRAVKRAFGKRFVQKLVVADPEKALISKLRKKFGTKHITPSYLRVEVPTSNTRSDYIFDITETGRETRTERKLNRNDVFIVQQMGLFLMRRDLRVVGADYIETYPNPVRFALPGINVRHLHIFYNGYLRIRVNNRVWYEALDSRRFLYIPETQQTFAGNYAQQLPEFGFVDVKPELKLFGNAKNEIVLSVPTFAGLNVESTDANEKVYLVFYVRGLLASGAALDMAGD